jgi:hypothetical protein
MEINRKKKGSNLLNDIIKRSCNRHEAEEYFKILIRTNRERKRFLEKNYSNYFDYQHFLSFQESWLPITYMNSKIYWNFKNGEKKAEIPFKFDFILDYFYLKLK